MNSKKPRRVTLQEVAEHAGVSRATASLIVRNSPKISEATRKKVLASMRELGYVYDRVAANLRSQTSSTIGIIITDVANTYFAELLLGVHQELEKHGYTVLLGTTFDSVSNQEHLISTMLEHRVGGIILCPVSNTTGESMERILSLGVPLVHTVRELPEINCDYVGVDYRQGAEMAIRHLIQKGHQRIAFIGGIPEATTWKERMEGYRMAHQKAGLPMDESLVLPSLPTREGGLAACQKILQHRNPPTAIFCFSDLIAFGVIIGLRKVGLEPGKDIDIVGFDNVPETEISYPPLTTVSSFARRTGSEAAKLLHERIKNFNREKQKIIISPELVVRG